jgi:hypothetical protein
MAKYPLRESARGEECQIRIPGACNHDNSTVVLCHLGGAGVGMKHDDDEAAYGCSACHDIVDGRDTAHGWTQVAVELMHREGVTRTRYIMKEKGLLTFKGMTAKKASLPR